MTIYIKFEEVKKVLGNENWIKSFMEWYMDLKKKDNRVFLDKNDRYKVINSISKKSLDHLLSLNEMKIEEITGENSICDFFGYLFSGKFDNSLKLNTTQLRKFFDTIKMFKEKYSTDEEIKNNLGEISMLDAYIAAAKGKRNIPDLFFHILRRYISELKEDPTQENLKKFVKFLEAVVAYNKYYGGD